MLYPFSRLCRPARSPASGSPALRKKRGFNLIESAVVLGVVGLVIGGIWVAAAKVKEDTQITETIRVMLLAVKKTQQVISAQDSLAIGNNVTMTQALANAEVFPSDWWHTGNYVYLPFDAELYIRNFSGSRFRIQIEQIKSKYVCIQLAVRMSNIQAGMGGASSINGLGLERVQIINGPVTASNLTATTFPITPAQAAAACEDRLSHVFFMFGYTRIN